MKLRQIKLAGFKTFVDPTNIKLDGQLAGIVGPNGCGKSNIMESVKWVLGSSSAKEMRGESMDSVIFSGTDTRQAIGRASVELFFDNSLGSAPDEWAQYAEISVKRVIEKEKGSTYYINNTAVRRKDVADLFLGTGLGSHGYAIIGQNTISQIVEAKPEELKNYLEEAAGVSKYKERRKETEYRLRDTRDNLARVEDLQKEINQQISKLESQAQAAKRHNELQIKLKFVAAQIAVLKKITANETWQNTKTKVVQNEIELEKQTAQLRTIEAEVELLRQTHIKTNDAVSNSQAKFYEANAAVTNTENKLNNLKEKIQNLVKLKEGSALKLQEFDLLTTEYDLQLAETKKIFESEKQKLTEETANLAEIKDLFSAIENKYSTDNKKYNETNSQWLQLKERLNVESATIELTEKIIADLSNRTNLLKEELSQINVNISGLEKPEILKKLEIELASIKDSSQQKKSEYEALEKETLEKRDLAFEAKQKITETQLRINSLKQTINKQFNPETINNWLNEIGAPNNDNVFKQVKIKKGWEKALSILLGSRIQAFYHQDKVFKGPRPPHGLTLINNVDFNQVEQNNSENQAINLIEEAGNSIMPALKEWLSDVYFCNENDEQQEREKLKNGQLLLNKTGDIYGLTYQIFADDDEDNSNQLTRIADLENLEKKLPSFIKASEDLDEAYSLSKTKLEDTKHMLINLDKQQVDVERQFNEANIEFNKKLSVVELNNKRRITIENDITSLDSEVQLNRNSLGNKNKLIEELKGQLINAETEKNKSEDEKHKSEQTYRNENEKLVGKEKLIQQIEFNIEINKNKINDLEDKSDRLVADKNNLINQLADTEEDSSSTELLQLQNDLKNSIEQKESAEKTLIEIKEEVAKVENSLREIESKRLELQHSLNPLQENLQQSKLDEREAKVIFEQRCSDINKLNQNEDEILSSLSENLPLQDYEKNYEGINARIERMGPVNLAAISELEVIRERQTYIQNQVDDLTQASKTLEDAIHKIDVETREKLKQTFDEVNENFTDFFKILFDGGKARLELLGHEILDTGIQVVAQPPGKKNTTIHLLSGGEKALTAIALVFALFKLNPAPFCLMDEVDAPLDDSNTERFSALVKKMAINTQFLFVSHNKITMEIAEQLIGVTMQEAGVSRIVEVDLQQIEKIEVAN
ncbi:MAG: chromosome segregation protein SMC [Proteobacteria bacterium]|nr:chromosome segregation protein SMC [Pseudomonadota bacterium]MDA0872651.1 chromosome segregation protein SMC [Pseudomonadota bacterium]MDA1134067.1 chromosome segregation protein SMC [Pseudomonadota bacterium]